MNESEFGFAAERHDGRVWKGQQSIEFEAHWKLGRGDMVRVRIDRDSSDFQSSAKAEVWTGTEWNLIGSIPYPLMATLEHSAYAKDGPTSAMFEKDERELIELAGLVLYGISQKER